MDNYDKFIGKLYDILLDSNIISYEDKPKDLKEKKERLEKYLDKLDRVQSKTISKEGHIDTLKRLYYDRYVIKRENIPDGYFKSLEKRYLDEGHGHHNLVNPDNDTDKRLKEEHINVIIREQKDSLDVWLNYFLSKDSDYLPMWAKVWAFQGMLGIGNLNKEKDGYGRRSNTAVNPFVSFDSEILGKCAELVKETFDNKEITDKEIDKLVSSGSFAKLYGKLLANKKQLKVVSDEGIWVKYNYETSEEADKKIKAGIEPEYLKLYNSLQGYNTGWCTAGSKETAKQQICGGESYQGGDFYVYYTKDKNNEYKVPRIAIRMNKESIGEIRGVASGQNIEANMEKALEEKLKEFPDGKLYQKKVHDMQLLTKIYDDYKKRNLTKDELKFLYEIDDKISGFGFYKDPRINEILDKRNKKKDLSIIFNCVESEIGLIEEDLYWGQLVYYAGDISFEQYKKLRSLNLNLPNHVNGSLDLEGLTATEGLILPKRVGGNLNLCGLLSAEGLIFPETVGGSLYLNKLTTAEGLILPQSVAGTLNLNSIITIKELKMPEKLGSSLGLNSLITAEGLVLPKRVGGNLNLISLKSANGLTLPESVDGSLDLEALTSPEGLILPQSVQGDLYLDGLETANGLLLPQNISGCLHLNGLVNADGLIFPVNLKGSLELTSLKSANCLVLPETIGGSLDLDSLTYVKGLVLPKSIGSFLSLNSLMFVEDLILPETIGGDLYLDYLVSAKMLKFPQTVRGNLRLSSLNSLKGLILPESVKYNVYYSNKYYTVERLKQLQQEEIKKESISSNRRGFTTGIFTIAFVLVVTILSILTGMLLVK